MQILKAGDTAEVRNEDVQKLNEIISKWLDATVSVNFWSVTNVMEYILTEDDIKSSNQSKLI